MAFNGSGTYSLYTPGNPVVSGTTIDSTWGNNTMNDIATALTLCITKDGQQTTTASIPFVLGIAVTTAITTPSTTFALVNTTATTVNFAGGATTAINVGGAGNTTTWTATTFALVGLLTVTGTGGFAGVLAANGGLARNVSSMSDATYTVLTTDSYLIANRPAGTITVTMPNAGTFSGRELIMKNIQAQTVVSDASNIVSQGGAAASTAILAASGTAWCLLHSNGTNWVIMASSA